MDAHWPYIPPHPFDSLYPGKVENYTHSRHYIKMGKEVMQFKRTPTEKEHHHLISQYDGGISFIDYHLGRLMRRLKELRLYDEALIIISSDHGEAFGKRYFIGHGNSVYQDLVHVPLVIKYPRIKRKHVVNEVVSIVDIMPTILDVLNFARTEEKIAGKSLLKYSQKPIASRLIISESFPDGWRIKFHQRFHRFERAIYSDFFKFIGSTSGKRELYNLSEDPNEMINLYNAEEEISNLLESRLNRWLGSVNTKFELTEQFDSDTIKKLKTLGYIR
jgi:arylsulfatase A-like enzyme